MEQLRFAIHVKFSEEDGEYVATCKEYPSLSYLAESLSEAFDGLAKIITEAIRDQAYGNQN